MNKQELIEKIESLPSLTSITSIRPYVDKKIVLGLISQLDEPEKAVISKFAADLLEERKEKRYRISMPKARNYKNHAQILCEKDGKIFWCGEWYPFRTKFTRKELENAGFGEVFNSTLFEVEEV